MKIPSGKHVFLQNAGFCTETYFEHMFSWEIYLDNSYHLLRNPPYRNTKDTVLVKYRNFQLSLLLNTIHRSHNVVRMLLVDLRCLIFDSSRKSDAVKTVVKTNLLLPWCLDILWRKICSTSVLVVKFMFGLFQRQDSCHLTLLPFYYLTSSHITSSNWTNWIHSEWETKYLISNQLSKWIPNKRQSL